MVPASSPTAAARAVPSGEKARLRTSSPSAKLMNLESPATVSALIAGGRGVGLAGAGVGGTRVSVAAGGEAVAVGGCEDPADRSLGSEHANITIAAASAGAVFFMVSRTCGSDSDV